MAEPGDWDFYHRNGDSVGFSTESVIEWDLTVEHPINGGFDGKFN
jgi:hypothetical protein